MALCPNTGAESTTMPGARCAPACDCADEKDFTASGCPSPRRPRALLDLGTEERSYDTLRQVLQLDEERSSPCLQRKRRAPYQPRPLGIGLAHP